MPLEEKFLKRAIMHLTAFGDTDIFPAPFEFRFFADESDKIISNLAKFDTSQHTPTSAFECLSPKATLSFRIAHQLYPIDTLLYTACAIEIAPAIEAMRLDRVKGPFSYRFIENDEEPRFFADSSSYHDWLCHIKEKFADEEPFSDYRYVLETDISDFYSRIYFHRLEHVLDDCGAPNSTRRLIENIIKSTRARQSYGLPVGSAASRILAEGLLIDTDRMVEQRADDYSRYVDDFRIIVKHQSDVHSLLCQLAEHLMLTEGLSLNASKTRSYSTTDGLKLIDAKLTDVFNDQEIVKLNIYIKSVYSDEDVSVEDIEDIEAIDLIEKLKEVSGRVNADYTAIRVILKALRAVIVDDPISLIKNHINLLYYTPRDFCILIGGIAQRQPGIAPEIAELLVEYICQEPYKDMALSRIWTSHLFTVQALPITELLRTKMKLTQTPIERRHDLLLRGILGDRSFFRSQKTKFDEASNWEKPALMLAASCLSTSEYKTWIDSIKNHFNDPNAEIYRKWLTSNQDELFNKIKENYIIKTKSEKIADLLDDITDTVD